MVFIDKGIYLCVSYMYVPATTIYMYVCTHLNHLLYNVYNIYKELSRERNSDC